MTRLLKYGRTNTRGQIVHPSHEIGPFPVLAKSEINNVIHTFGLWLAIVILKMQWSVTLWNQ